MCKYDKIFFHWNGVNLINEEKWHGKLPYKSQFFLEQSDNEKNVFSCLYT